MYPHNFAAPVDSPSMMDFFTIYEVDGVKFIHVLGYLYESDTYWANMECVGFNMPLAEFIKGTQERNAEGESFMDEVYQECEQYQDDCTAEQVVKIINTYFDGKPADYFCPVLKLTEESPCSNYVC